MAISLFQIEIQKRKLLLTKTSNIYLPQKLLCVECRNPRFFHHIAGTRFSPKSYVPSTLSLRNVTIISFFGKIFIWLFDFKQINFFVEKYCETSGSTKYRALIYIFKRVLLNLTMKFKNLCYSHHLFSSSFLKIVVYVGGSSKKLLKIVQEKRNH